MYKGVFAAVATPFKNGRVDLDAMKRHILWLLENGVAGVVVCATTGEGPTLKTEEYRLIVDAIAREMKGKGTLIAGAGSNSTMRGIELAKVVMEAGADATLQVTPYYNKPTEEGLYQHFKLIAEEVPCPHILYNVPSRTGVNMSPSVVAKLSNIKNIVGVKEASGNLSQIEEIKKVVPRDFSILSGNDDQNLDIYKLGGCGTISVTANIAPRQVVEVYRLFSGGNLEEARALQERLLPLNKAMFIETNPIPVKTALSLMGFMSEEFRLPLTPISPENKKYLIKILRSYELID